jgi:formylglycine-generating enzyme required for sulfatase activity
MAINITGILPVGVELAMRWIPPGTFMMGSPANEVGRWDDEGPRHSVTLTRGFYMGIYPVTQEQYAAVMTGNVNGANASPSNFGSSPADGEVQARRPVEMVRWYHAILFCNRLSMQQGLTPVYNINGSTNPANWGFIPTSFNNRWDAVTANWNANGYRLPTEAEWEYACRAGTTTAWYTGNTADATLQAAAWYDVNSAGRPRQVGLKTPNALGLYDMMGNVWEWVWDWFGNSTYTSAARTDPRGPGADVTSRVVRGGSWRNSAEWLRSAIRERAAPSTQSNGFGFRVARFP